MISRILSLIKTRELDRLLGMRLWIKKFSILDGDKLGVIIRMASDKCEIKFTIVAKNNISVYGPDTDINAKVQNYLMEVNK
jgi:hypothetical protein